MRCTNWRIASLAVAIVTGVATFTGSASAARASDAPDFKTSNRVTVIDDAEAGELVSGRFDYIGSWQHVSGKRDGRSNGTSSRSTRLGDSAILRFTGTRVRLFGVLGPSGGRAGIALDDKSTGRPVDFYAPRLATHALIYQSPILAAGPHMISIIVWGTRDPRGRFYYVNIDGAEIESDADGRGQVVTHRR